MSCASLFELFQVLPGVASEIKPIVRPATDMIDAVTLKKSEALFVRGPALATEDKASRLTDSPLCFRSDRSSETRCGGEGTSCKEMSPLQTWSLTCLFQPRQKGDGYLQESDSQLHLRTRINSLYSVLVQGTVVES